MLGNLPVITPPFPIPPCSDADISVAGWEKLPAENRARLSNETLAWLDTFPDDWPEVEYQDIAFSLVPDDVGPNDQYMTFGVALLTAKSRGNVTLRSNDTIDYPVITLNWLLDPIDQEVAVEAFKRQRIWARGTGIVVDEFNPPESVETDEEILNWLKDEATFIYHASSGCKSSPTIPTSVLRFSALTKAFKPLEMSALTQGTNSRRNGSR